MRYPTRKEKWVSALLWGTTAFCYLCAAGIFFADMRLAAQLVFAVVFAACGVITHTAVAGTFYVIDDGRLHIRSGVLLRKTIPLSEIARIKPVVSWEATAALSNRRLRIYGKSGYWDISPERADEFIRELREAAPHVRVESG